MRKRVLAIMNVLLLLMLMSCSNENNITNSETPKPELTVAESTAIDGLNKFSINFFKEISSQHTDKNLVVSPLSATMLVSMLGNVADETSRNQICESLGSKDFNTLNSLASKYLSWLPSSDTKAKMHIANSVWYDDDYTINPEFNKSGLEFYSTDFFARNFSNSTDVVNDINNWTNTKTAGLISEIIDNVHKSNPAILINALFFKSNWAQPFKTENTKTEYFYGRNGRTEIDMMFKTDIELYAENDDCQFIKLKFGKGIFELLLMLPKPHIDIESFISSNNLDNYSNLYFTTYNVALSLPRFEIKPNYQLKLSATFAKLGIDNISKMQNYSLFTEDTDLKFDIFQKSAIEFNEKGVEAASTTWTDSDIFLPMENKTVEINRPFIFFINEASTNLCLFAGHVMNL